MADFPIGARIGGGAFVIEERIAGTPLRGLYRAADRSGGAGSLLVALGTAQRGPLAEVERALAMELEGITRLRHVGPIQAEGQSDGDGGGGEYHALVEDEPAGRPSSSLAPLAPAAAVGLALDVAALLGRAHAAGLHLPHLRPELIYAEERDGAPRLTAVAPRAEPFLAGAAAPSPGVPPLFESLHAAPELLALSPATEASDVWALCASLWTWVTGAPLLPGEGTAAQLTALLRGTRRPWTGPARLGRVLAPGLEPDPSRRPRLDRLVVDLPASL